jgi:hypothetical protein
MIFEVKNFWSFFYFTLFKSFSVFVYISVNYFQPLKFLKLSKFYNFYRIIQKNPWSKIYQTKFYLLPSFFFCWQWWLKKFSVFQPDTHHPCLFIPDLLYPHSLTNSNVHSSHWMLENITGAIFQARKNLRYKKHITRVWMSSQKRRMMMLRL